MTRGMGARAGGVAWGSCWREAGAREMVELLQLREIDGREKEMLKIDDCGLFISPCRFQERQVKG